MEDKKIRKRDTPEEMIINKRRKTYNNKKIRCTD